MEYVLLGGHPAIDFLNTSLAPDGERVEKIPDGRAWLGWLVATGLLEEGGALKLARRFGADALDAAATEARKVREWARGWLGRWRSRPSADYGEEIAMLNKLLTRAASSRTLVATRKGFEIIESQELETASALIALVAQQLAALLAKEDPTLVRECAGPACTLWFLDRTKAHRRMFCSASACGNRAKVAAFRSRQRG